MTVHVLATCRDPSLLRMTTLVFETIRVGFPTAQIIVTGNALHDFAREELQDILPKLQISFSNDEETIHHEWIKKLVETETQPFWILDSDTIFYEAVENWKFNTALAGFRTPEWQDEFTNCITRSRLHPSLLWIDPVKVRAGITAFQSGSPNTVFTPKVNLFNPLVLPLNGLHYFHDTCSLLYQAIGGTAFTDQQKDAYHHFHFGTIPDLVLPRMRDAEAIAAERAAILNHPQLGRGHWKRFEEGYASRAPAYPGRDVIAAVAPEDSKTAQRWNFEICNGNREAMDFCNLWYHYCHGVDDLIDTMQDGRPVMSREQMISLFFNAAVIYNSPFFNTNRSLLFPVVLQITNTYADSVAWERSPKKHLRAMGDVFRTCGNEMYFMVALLCGGEAHMRKYSQLIKERDWLRQHDEHGNPI